MLFVKLNAIMHYRGIAFTFPIVYRIFLNRRNSFRLTSYKMHVILHALTNKGRLVQLVRTHPSHGWGHKFESCSDHHFLLISVTMTHRWRIFCVEFCGWLSMDCRDWRFSVFRGRGHSRRSAEARLRQILCLPVSRDTSIWNLQWANLQHLMAFLIFRGCWIWKMGWFFKKQRSVDFSGFPALPWRQNSSASAI